MRWLVLVLAACGGTSARPTEIAIPAERLVGVYEADPIPATATADPQFDDRLLVICADGLLGLAPGQDANAVGTWDRWQMDHGRFVVVMVEPPRGCVLSTTPGIVGDCERKPIAWRMVNVTVRATADGLETRKPRVGWSGDGMIDVVWRRRADLDLCD